MIIIDADDTGRKTKDLERVKRMIDRIDRKNFLIRDNNITQYLRNHDTLWLVKQSFPYYWTLIHILSRLDRPVRSTVHLLNRNDFPGLYRFPNDITLLETLKLISLHVKFYLESYSPKLSLSVEDEAVKSFLASFYKEESISPKIPFHLDEIVHLLKGLKYPDKNGSLWKDLDIKFFTVSPKAFQRTGFKLKAIRFRRLQDEYRTAKWAFGETDLINKLIALENGFKEPSLWELRKLIQFYQITNPSFFPVLNQTDPDLFSNIIKKEDELLSVMSKMPLSSRIRYFRERANLNFNAISYRINTKDDLSFMMDRELNDLTPSQLMILIKVMGSINLELQKIGYHIDILNKDLFPELFNTVRLDIFELFDYVRLHILNYIALNHLDPKDIALEVNMEPFLLNALLNFSASDNSNHFSDPLFADEIEPFQIFDIAKVLTSLDGNNFFDELQLSIFNLENDPIGLKLKKIRKQLFLTEKEVVSKGYIDLDLLKQMENIKIKDVDKLEKRESKMLDRLIKTYGFRFAKYFY